jgi:hypothetical protein
MTYILSFVMGNFTLDTGNGPRHNGSTLFHYQTRLSQQGGGGNNQSYPSVQVVTP